MNVSAHTSAAAVRSAYKLIIQKTQTMSQKATMAADDSAAAGAQSAHPPRSALPLTEAERSMVFWDNIVRVDGELLCEESSSLTMVETRMAFYAKIIQGGKLMLNEEDAKEWRRDLPAAIRAQHLLLDNGELPVVMSLANVRRLKTLAIKNENFRTLQRDGQCWEGGQADGDGGSEP